MKLYGRVLLNAEYKFDESRGRYRAAQMKPYYEQDGIQLFLGDCREVLPALADCSVDSIVTDPPYELGFMGKSWDRSGIAYQVEVWRECLRVLKHGGHLLAFGGSRTHYRLGCAIEDAGFELRDTITWIFGSGFPKSLNVSQRLKDSLPADAQCVCVRRSTRTAQGFPDDYQECRDSYDGQLQMAIDNDLNGAPLQVCARGRSRVDQLAGVQESLRANTFSDEDSAHRSTCYLRPRNEALGGSPFSDSAQSDRPLSTSSGRLTAERKRAIGTQDKSRLASDSASFSSTEVYPNLPRCSHCNKYRIPEGVGTALKPAAEYIVMARKPLNGTVAENVLKHGTGGINVDGCRVEAPNGLTQGGMPTSNPCFMSQTDPRPQRAEENPFGRWPANVIHDGSDEVVSRFPETASGDHNGIYTRSTSKTKNTFSQRMASPEIRDGDSGSAARFFYCAKASKEDREEGLEDLPVRSAGEVTDRQDGSDGLNSPRAGAGRTNGSRNHHPTVKPTELMRYLVRLVTPPNGIVLDPFGGSGSTAKACALEDLNAILIEKEIQYCEIAMRRAQLRQMRLLFA